VHPVGPFNRGVLGAKEGKEGCEVLSASFSHQASWKKSFLGNWVVNKGRTFAKCPGFV